MCLPLNILQSEKSVLKYNAKNLTPYSISHLTKTEFGETVICCCFYCARSRISLMQLTVMLAYFSNSHITLLTFFMVVIKWKSHNFAICTVAQPAHSHAADLLNINRTWNEFLLNFISFVLDQCVSWHHFHAWCITVLVMHPTYASPFLNSIKIVSINIEPTELRV